MKRKAGVLGEFGGDAEGAVERDGGVEQGGEFLGEEEDVAAAPLPKEGSLNSSGGFSGRDADVDRGEALLAEFAGDQFLVVAGEAAGADLAIAGDGAEEEGGGHQSGLPCAGCCSRTSRRTQR